MSVQLREKRQFDKSSPVTRYWLANCEGFRIAGTAGGRVEEVVAEVDARRPVELVVRGFLGQRRVVPTQAVEAVVPAEKLLILEAGAVEERRAERVRRERSLELARHATSSSGRLIRQGSVWARPRIGRLLGAALMVLTMVSLALLELSRALLTLVLRAAKAAGQAVEEHRRRLRQRREAGARSAEIARHRQGPATSRPHAAVRRARGTATRADHNLSRPSRYS
jgi:hypothetical protein